METNNKVVYRIDSQDRIIFVNEVWHDFAMANGAQSFTVEHILNRPIWNFIGDSTTRMFYREAMRLARSNRPMSFEFRCDSSDLKRLMRMTISTFGTDLQFECEPLRIEDRPSQMLLETDIPRSDELIVVCGWCKKVNIGEQIWREIEHAVHVLRLFERERLPALSHGICGTCHDIFFAKLRQLYG